MYSAKLQSSSDEKDSEDDVVTIQLSREQTSSKTTIASPNLLNKNKKALKQNFKSLIRRSGSFMSRERSSPVFVDDLASGFIFSTTKTHTHSSFTEYPSLEYFSHFNTMNDPSDLKKIKPSFSGPLTHHYSFIFANNFDTDDTFPSEQATMDSNKKGFKIFGESRKQSTAKEELELRFELTKVSRSKSIPCTLTVLNNQLLHWKDKYIEMDTIRDIRILEHARNYREQLGISEEIGNYWITIIYQAPKNRLKALHAYASTMENLQNFYSTIYHIVKQRHEIMKRIALPNSDEFVEFHWANLKGQEKKGFAKGRNNITLNFENIASICSKFNILCSASYLKHLYNKSDLDEDNLLNYEEFGYFVKLLKTRPDITNILHQYSKNGKYMNFQDFKNFVISVQQEQISENKIHELFKKYANSKLGVISSESILRYLTDQPYLVKVTSPSYYDHPLNHYFISSSHNTYLRGNQVGDNSTVESYIEALQRGCRCVEVDVWDGDNGPVVCHGILSGSISLKSVLEVIAKYAFITSPYPLIVSFEVHCKDANQIIMIYLINEYFKKMLAPKFENGLMSPNSLKNKILLKFTKRGKCYDNDTYISSTTSLDNSSEDEETPEFKNGNLRNTFTKKNKVPILPSLLDLSNIQGTPFRNFSLDESKTCTHSFSFSEKKFKSLSKNTIQRYAINKHNRRFLMRVYPHALRYKSTNFNPIEFWRLGVQMVATNWQTFDVGQQLNRAMFLSPMQDSCHWSSGYVLKPQYLIPKVKIKNMAHYYENLKLDSLKISIGIISAQWLHKSETMIKVTDDSNIDIVTEIEFFADLEVRRDIQVQCGSILSPTKAQTKYVRDNGINPVWNARTEIEFFNTELIFIMFTVKTKESIVLGTSCVKLYDLKKGYRHIPLFNTDTGEKYIFSTLFINVNY